MGSFPISPKEFISTLKTFSKRARRVLSEAHLETEKRGTGSVDVNSLIVGLIAEDQNLEPLNLKDDDPAVKKPVDERMAEAEKIQRQKQTLTLVCAPRECWKSREPVFSAQVAADLLSKLNQVLPSSNSVRCSTGTPVSPEFVRVSYAAKALKDELHQSNLEPLHLLAAALRERARAQQFYGRPESPKKQWSGSCGAGGGLENNGFTARDGHTDLRAEY
jgi:hypothetical protein